MANPIPNQRLLTVEEYFALEETAELRHEYIAGEVYAMTGGTIRHAVIIGNMFTKLRAAATDGTCRVFTDNLRVRVAGDIYYYPDVVVGCGDEVDTDVFLREACCIVEVTSRSTRSTDYREKLIAYRQMPLLQMYIVVAHARRRVDVHAKTETGEWTHEQLVGSGDVDVPCPRVRMTLDDVYEGVTLPLLGEPEAAAYEA